MRKVEFTLIEMPLPRLQVVGNEVDPFIYKIWWQPKELWITRSGMMKPYEKFDNRIHLVDGAGEHLVRLSGLLRPIVQSRWTRLVANFNKFEEAELEDFLFGADRTSTAPVRAQLIKLQEARCFYCRNEMRNVEVDHFIPWARYPDNSLSNLVASCKPCNSKKRAYLAAGPHVERWASRISENTTTERALKSFADDRQWPYQPEKSLSVARGIYYRLPDDAKLWKLGDEFLNADVGGLRLVLGG